MLMFLTFVNMAIGIVIVKALTGNALPTLEIDLSSWAFWSWIILFTAGGIAALIELSIYNAIRFKQGGIE